MNKIFIIMSITILLLIYYVCTSYNGKTVVNITNKFSVNESELLNDGGRGLYAEKDYKEGELIEACPALKIDIEMGQLGVIDNYVFTSYDGKSTLLAHGYCSMINHSESMQNSTWVVSEDDQYIKMYAIRDIVKGEEFYIHYGDSYWSTRDDKRL